MWLLDYHSEDIEEHDLAPLHTKRFSSMRADSIQNKITVVQLLLGKKKSYHGPYVAHNEDVAKYKINHKS